MYVQNNKIVVTQKFKRLYSTPLSKLQKYTNRHPLEAKGLFLPLGQESLGSWTKLQVCSTRVLAVNRCSEAPAIMFLVDNLISLKAHIHLVHSWCPPSCLIFEDNVAG